MKYLCSHCGRFVPARLVIRSAAGLRVGPHRDCVGYHAVRSIGKPRTIPPRDLEKGYLGRLMYDRSEGSVEKIVARLEEKARDLADQ